MNSGVTEVEIYGEHYIFRGNSGSEYWCHMETYGLRMNNAGIYKDLCLQQEFKGQIILMPEDTKWTNIKYD